MVLPFCCLHSAFYSVSLKIFLHHLLDFIPLDFEISSRLRRDLGHGAQAMTSPGYLSLPPPFSTNTRPPQTRCAGCAPHSNQMPGLSLNIADLPNTRNIRFIFLFVFPVDAGDPSPCKRKRRRSSASPPSVQKRFETFLIMQEFLSGDAARRTYTFGPRKENSEAHVPGIFVFSFDSASCMRRNSDKTCWTF